ncbi:MAG TPA: glycoside hydrolase family 31 protein [Bryobacteraceae bacterium]|nr:glycoside hydrolase family 31 protein [Bryobacteraceae bacterium]
MKTLVSFAACALLLAGSAAAIDLTGLTAIGDLAGYASARASVTVTCTDRSQIRLYILAPDLIRVRASFAGPLPERDHSWAIAKTAWDVPKWSVSEEADGLLVTTGEVEVVLHRSPLLIEFRDAATHRTINADARPVMWHPQADHEGLHAVAAAKTLGVDEHFYGLGEKAAHFDKRRGQFSMWNSDTPAYKEGTDPIYQDIPFYIGWQHGQAYGIFFDNSYRSHFDFAGDSPEYVTFGADGGEMNYYFFWGPSIKKVLGRYADLTGHLPLPPKWALGNQQSRWSYYPDKVAEEIVSRYRAEDLPLDVLHLDIDYMNGYRVFTWDPHGYPDPSAFTAKLRKQGVKVVVIVDPGVKYEPPPPGATDATSNPELAPQNQTYYVFNQGLAKDYFLKRRDGKLWIGAVWPGKAVYVDYTLDAAARWWGDLHRAYLDHGVAGIWNDMNEPSDFVDQTGRTQMDVVTYDEDAHSPYAENRNVFALNEARATYEGLERLRPDERPYVITRAAYAGIQRYSTMWTGDNTSTWDAMALSIPMFETLGLSGEPFVGADAGGFIGRTDGEMLARWYQIAFLTPFCRNHAQRDAYDHEPWRFGTYYENIIRKYLKLRYRFLPFLYTTLEEANRTGVPVFRPLLLNYQEDANVLDLDDEFMIGSDLLVAPILRPNLTSRHVYLPEGTWFDYWTGQRLAGGRMIHAEAPLETVPLYVRGGAIIPMGPEMNYVGEKSTDPLTFEIYPDVKGNARTSLYEDDGISPAYRNGASRRTTVTYQPSGIDVSAPTGSYQPGSRTMVFEIRGAQHRGKPLQLADDGRPHHIAIQ